MNDYNPIPSRYVENIKDAFSGKKSDGLIIKGKEGGSNQNFSSPPSQNETIDSNLRPSETYRSTNIREVSNPDEIIIKELNKGLNLIDDILNLPENDPRRRKLLERLTQPTKIIITNPFSSPITTQLPSLADQIRKLISFIEEGPSLDAQPKWRTGDIEKNNRSSPPTTQSPPTALTDNLNLKE